MKNGCCLHWRNFISSNCGINCYIFFTPATIIHSPSSNNLNLFNKSTIKNEGNRVEMNELGWKPITFFIAAFELKDEIQWSKQFINQLNSLPSFNKNKRTFLFISFNQFISWIDLMESKDIITVLSYIGWPVLNNKSMKENLFGWNWFIWAMGGLWTAAAHQQIKLFFSIRSLEWADWRKVDCCGPCGIGQLHFSSSSSIPSNFINYWWIWMELKEREEKVKKKGAALFISSIKST